MWSLATDHVGRSVAGARTVSAGRDKKLLGRVFYALLITLILLHSCGSRLWFPAPRVRSSDNVDFVRSCDNHL